MMRDFNAQLTLIDSAQAFHWKRVDGLFAANVNGRVMTSEDTDARACDYFDDARDYGALCRECAAYPRAVRALDLLPGLRVLNQPAWEALVAFILSANNNVSRIRNLVDALCREYGSCASFRGEALWGFPAPEALARADVAELRAKTRCGYRAGYLVDTAKMVCEGFPLDALSAMPVDEAHAALTRLPGVGPKVADCVLLFGCRQTSAFPVDVWVKRLMEDWFGVKGSVECVRREARRLLGEHCGLIQQSLFHAARTGRIDVGRGNER